MNYNKFTVDTNVALTFLETVETCNEFRNAIDYLESLNVVLDFRIHYSDYSFIGDSNQKEDFKLIHIEKSSYDYDYDLSNFENPHTNYIKRKTISLNLDDESRLFRIFSSIYNENFSYVIYDFYDNGVSFFISNKKAKASNLDAFEIEIIDNTFN